MSGLLQLDPELGAIFRAETSERLQSLEAALLRLETEPGDGATLDAAFRDAHNLKGAARMVGALEVAEVTHRFEDLLGGAKRGQVPLGPELIDRLTAALDGIRALVEEVLSGAPAGVTAAELAACIAGTGPIPVRAAESPAAEPPAPPGAPPVLDAELASLFRAESDERIQNLDAGLLRLEESPADTAALDAVFREAHNLKGAARMVGATAVSEVAHRFEDILGALRRGGDAPAPERMDRLYQALDGMRLLAREVLTGGPAGFTAGELIAWIEGPAGEMPPPWRRSDPPAPAPAAAEAAPLPVSTDPPATAARGAADFRIEAIRVDPRKLDTLLTHSGELKVTRERLARRQGEIDHLISVYSEWSREVLQRRWSAQQRMRLASDDARRQVAELYELELERLDCLGMLLECLRVESYGDSARLEYLADRMEEGIRELRLLPLSTVFNLFPRMVRDLARAGGKEIRLLIEGAETAVDKRILEEIKDPLMHMLRNACDHGVEGPDAREAAGKPQAATLRIRASQSARDVLIEIEDDGGGIDVEAVRRAALKRGIRTEAELARLSRNEVELLIFAPGFSTRAEVTDVSGRGVGMDVVRTNIERLKGTISIDSRPGQGCTFQVRLPKTLATTRVLLVAVGGQLYGLPIDWVERICSVADTDLFSVQGAETVSLDGQAVSVVRLAQLLGIENGRGPLARRGPTSRPCVVLSLGKQRLGLLVDSVTDEQEVVLKPLGGVLQRVPNVSGLTILSTGEICIVLNPMDLLRRQRPAAPREPTGPVEMESAEPRPARAILLVDDSITTRMHEKRIIEAAGYEVVTAVDGLDGFNKLCAGEFAAVVSDIEMPNLDGLALTSRIRQHPQHRDLPVILVSSLSAEEDRKRGFDVGASAYIPKPAFNQKSLTEALRRLV
ncbi:MAG: Hpt domain-containing protein [Armatimonadota bacterium]